MIDIWPGVEARFKSDAMLVKLGRHLYVGVPDASRKPTVPAVEFHVDSQAQDGGFGFDLESLLIRFVCVAGAGRRADIIAMMHAVDRVFHTAAIESADWICVRFDRSGGSGPTQGEGHWTGDLIYDVDVQARTLTPAFQGT